MPHEEGFTLIADRQDTHDEGRKTETTKLFAIPDHGVAIGCSGHTDIYRHLMYRLENFSPRSTIYFELQTIVNEDYPQFEKTASILNLPAFFDPEFIIGRINEGKCLVEKFRYLAHPKPMIDKLNPDRCNILGHSWTRTYFTPQFRMLDGTFTKDEAIEFGASIIAYASLVDPLVGSPRDFGCEAITITYDSEMIREGIRYDPELINRLLYRRSV